MSAPPPPPPLRSKNLVSAKRMIEEFQRRRGRLTLLAGAGQNLPPPPFEACQIANSPDPVGLNKVSNSEGESFMKGERQGPIPKGKVLQQKKAYKGRQPQNRTDFKLITRRASESIQNEPTEEAGPTPGRRTQRGTPSGWKVD